MNINIQVDKSLFGGGNAGTTGVNTNINQSLGNSSGGTPMININGAPSSGNNNGNNDMMSRLNSGVLPPNSSLMHQRAKK